MLGYTIISTSDEVNLKIKLRNKYDLRYVYNLKN